ncbi:MAG: hypothetical protein AAB490_00410 [Patescibacteria group bacterium]
MYEIKFFFILSHMPEIERGQNNLNHEERLTQEQQTTIGLAVYHLSSHPQEYDRVLEQTDPVLHREIAKLLIRTGQAREMILSLQYFQNLDPQIIIDLLIEGKKYKGELITHNLDKFEGLNHQEIALKLIGAKKGWEVVESLERFENLDRHAIAMAFIATGQFAPLAAHLNKFEGLNHQEIALKIIEAGGGLNVEGYIHNFHGLSEETLEQLEAMKKEAEKE